MKRDADACVVALESGAGPSAEAWARRLGLPLAEAGGPPAAVRLEVGSGGLALRGDGPAVRVDVAALARPRPGGRDLLARAVGRLEPGEEVLDATAGLGRDAFQLAALGYRVIMVERVALIAALLEDALDRAVRGVAGEEAAEAAGRVRLFAGDATAVLAALAPPPAVVVLDPMYPHRRGNALPNKGMRLFRELVGSDDDAPALLEAARGAARRRVVVKRPARAPALGGERPSGSLTGRTTRYDLYAPAQPAGAGRGGVP